MRISSHDFIGRTYLLKSSFSKNSSRYSPRSIFTPYVSRIFFFINFVQFSICISSSRYTIREITLLSCSRKYSVDSSDQCNVQCNPLLGPRRKNRQVLDFLVSSSLCRIYKLSLKRYWIRPGTFFLFQEDRKRCRWRALAPSADKCPSALGLINCVHGSGRDESLYISENRSISNLYRRRRESRREGFRPLGCYDGWGKEKR